MLERQTPFYHQENELDALFYAVLPPAETIVRDVYLLQVDLGVRFGDLRRMLREGISKFMSLLEGRAVLNLVTGKTGSIVCIPMRKRSIAILSKYNFLPFKVPSLATLNEKIKEICKQIGICSYQVVRSYFQDGQLVDVTYNAYQLVSTHTARRTFATLAYLAWVPIHMIMLITGHKTIEAFLLYIGADQIDNVVRLLRHPYFSSSMPEHHVAMCNLMPLNKIANRSVRRKQPSLYPDRLTSNVSSNELEFHPILTLPIQSNDM